MTPPLTPEQLRAVREYQHACDEVHRSERERADRWDEMIHLLTPEQAVQYTTLRRMSLLAEAVEGQS